MPKQEYSNTPAKSKPFSPEDKEAETRTKSATVAEMQPVAEFQNLKLRRAPYFPAPRSMREAEAKIKHLTIGMERSMEDYVYKMGKIFAWVKAHRPREFETWVKTRTRHSVRTARYYKTYFYACVAAGRGENDHRMIPYDYRARGAQRAETVSALQVPEDPDEVEKIKKHKPHHDSEPLNWSAQECATRLLSIFEKFTARRTIEEMRDALAAFNEFAGEYIEERETDRKALRGEEEDES